MIRSVTTDIWHWLKGQSPEAKLLHTYFLTNPHTHLTGAYHIAIPTICHETGLSVKAIRKGVDALSKAELVHYDEETETVWVVGMLRDQGRGPKVVAAVVRQLSSLWNWPFLQEFLTHYQDLNIPFEIPHGYPIDRVSMTHRYHSISKTKTKTESKTEEGEESEKREGTVTPEWLKEYWNGIPGVAQANELTGPVLQSIRARIKDHPTEAWWKKLFDEEIKPSDFLCGRSGDGWTATLDWVCRPKNLAKILSGNYRNRQLIRLKRQREPPRTTIGNILKFIGEAEEKERAATSPVVDPFEG